MAVITLDISLAARAAGHLFLTTPPIAYFIIVLLIVLPLTNFTYIPISWALIVIDGCAVALGISLLSAIYYARRELNGWAYAIAAACTVLIAASLPISLVQRTESIEIPFLSGPFLLAVYLIRVLIDYVRLASSKYNALNMPQLRLANEVSKLLRRRRNQVPWLHVPTNPIRTSIYTVVFALSVPIIYLIWFGVQWSQAQHEFQHNLITDFGGWLVLVGIAYLAAMVALIRRHYVLRADRVLELDNRPPIIFLRSFADDKVRLWGKGVLGKFRRKTIDEAIKRSIERLGPLVAIANPKMKLPRLGAAQTYFSNETWQSAIVRWVQMSQMIVMVAGRTEGIRWELDHIFSSDGQNKLVIFLPPALRKDSIATTRWLNEHFSQTPYHRELAAIEPKKVIAIAFRGDALFIMETRRIRRREVDYLVALQAIIFAMTANVPTEQAVQAM